MITTKGLPPSNLNLNPILTIPLMPNHNPQTALWSCGDIFHSAIEICLLVLMKHLQEHTHVHWPFLFGFPWPALSIGPSPLDRLLIHASCQTVPALLVLWRASARVEAALLQTLVPWITACTQGASVYCGAACPDDNVHGHKGDILKGGSDKTGAKEAKLWVFPERITKEVVCVCVLISLFLL